MNNGTFHRYLLYFISVLIGIIFWALAALSGEVAMVRSIQSERKHRVESIAQMQEKLERLSVRITEMATVDAIIKRHEETLRRLEDRLNILRRDGKWEPWEGR